MADFSTPAGAQDTIVAESTGRGGAAIAVVRLSGPEARAIAQRLCASPPARPPRSHQLHRQRLIDATGATLDEAMVAHMVGPNSYTGEDVVELQLHGSRAVVAATLAACVAAGARPAEPGEFTRRAYLAGKLDLSQAEAVAALCAAHSDRQRLAALRLLDGHTGRALAPLIDTLERVLAAWRASLDFPDEVDETLALPAALAELAQVADALDALVAGAQLLGAQAPKVVLMGGVNVGKSTLLNAVAGEERALVSAQAGTTRDAIGVAHAANGEHFTLWDTAGLRPGAQGIEARGVALARRHAAAADLRLWLLGAPEPGWPPADAGDVWVVGSQADVLNSANKAAIEAEAARRGLFFAGWICAPRHDGVAALLQRVGSALAQAAARTAAGEVLALRHRGLLREAAAALRASVRAAAEQLPLDCLLAELEQAAACLGQVLGRDVDGAALDRIFADFCLGK